MDEGFEKAGTFFRSLLEYKSLSCYVYALNVDAAGVYRLRDGRFHRIPPPSAALRR